METTTTSTCIVSLVRNGTVHIGGDSAGVSGLNIMVRKDVKVFNREDAAGNKWVFGFTTSFRMGQLIQYNLKLPKLKKNEKDLHAFMVRELIPALKKCLKEGQWEHRKEDRTSGGTFLVGVRGETFIIGDDYQVGQRHGDFMAVGCGAQVALGAMFAAAKINPKMPPVEFLTLGLEAATHFNGGVRPPYVFKHT